MYSGIGAQLTQIMPFAWWHVSCHGGICQAPLERDVASSLHALSRDTSRSIVTKLPWSFSAWFQMGLLIPTNFDRQLRKNSRTVWIEPFRESIFKTDQYFLALPFPSFPFQFLRGKTGNLAEQYLHSQVGKHPCRRGVWPGFWKVLSGRLALFPAWDLCVRIFHSSAEDPQ